MRRRFNDPLLFPVLCASALLATSLALTGCGDGDAGETDETASGTSGDTTTSPTGSTDPTSGNPTQDPSGSETMDATDATTATTDPTEGPTTDPTEGPTTDPTDPTDTTGPTTDTTGPTTGPTTDPTDTGSESDTDMGCGICNEPNQECIDDECVTFCQGQDPDPCQPDEVCNVITGECSQPDNLCTLAGDYTACGEVMCGPGSVCDGQNSCIPIAPCGNVECTSEDLCWGTECNCSRYNSCDAEPDLEGLNGPFSSLIADLEFADDCTAWMVTLRSGTDYVRRLETDGTLTEWAGVSNLNMGEVKVLKALRIPASTQQGIDKLKTPEPVQAEEGLGEVAITYTCCPSCGCFVDPPQGVARLNEDDMQNPLPIVIPAVATQGSGPFGSTAADAGPMGLTWGEDRVLYVGNTSQNGDLNTADLDAETLEVLSPLPDRIHAAAAVSDVHLIVAIEGGAVFLYNTLTLDLLPLVDLESDVTSLSHDAFSGLVYAGLQSLEVVVIKPFTGDVETFDTMVGPGRVTVSPNGELYYNPIKYINNVPLTKWDLPDEL